MIGLSSYGDGMMAKEFDKFDSSIVGVDGPHKIVFCIVEAPRYPGN